MENNLFGRCSIEHLYGTPKQILKQFVIWTTWTKYAMPEHSFPGFDAQNWKVTQNVFCVLYNMLFYQVIISFEEVLVFVQNSADEMRREL